MRKSRSRLKKRSKLSRHSHLHFSWGLATLILSVLLLSLFLITRMSPRLFSSLFRPASINVIYSEKQCGDLIGYHWDDVRGCIKNLTSSSKAPSPKASVKASLKPAASLNSANDEFRCGERGGTWLNGKCNMSPAPKASVKTSLKPTASPTSSLKPSSGGASCEGGIPGVRIPAGSWASTGHGLDANGQRCTVSPCPKRECVRCGSNGEWETKTVACDVKYKEDPTKVILPPEPGYEYTQGTNPPPGIYGSDPSAKANCYAGSVVHSTGTLQGGNRCYGGEWLPEADFDTKMTSQCATQKLDYDATTNQCVPKKVASPSPTLKPSPSPCGNGFTFRNGFCDDNFAGDRSDAMHSADKAACTAQGFPYDTNTGLCQAQTSGRPRTCSPGPVSNSGTNTTYRYCEVDSSGHVTSEKYVSCDPQTGTYNATTGTCTPKASTPPTINPPINEFTRPADAKSTQTGMGTVWINPKGKWYNDSRCDYAHRTNCASGYCNQSTHKCDNPPPTKSSLKPTSSPATGTTYASRDACNQNLPAGQTCAPIPGDPYGYYYRIGAQTGTQVGGDTNDPSKCKYGVSGPGQTAGWACNPQSTLLPLGGRCGKGFMSGDDDLCDSGECNIENTSDGPHFYCVDPETHHIPPGTTIQTIPSQAPSASRPASQAPPISPTPSQTTEIPGGEKCSGANANSSCESGSCQYLVKPGTTDPDWYCMGSNTHTTGTYSNNGQRLYLNDDHCTENSQCASNYCADFRGHVLQPVSWNSCADNPFSPPTITQTRFICDLNKSFKITTDSKGVVAKILDDPCTSFGCRSNTGTCRTSAVVESIDTINNSDELFSYEGKECSTAAGTSPYAMYSGKIADQNGQTREDCQLVCEYDKTQDMYVIKIGTCPLAATAKPTDPYCAGGKVVQRNSSGGQNILDACANGCQNAACVEKEASSCTTPGEIRPNQSDPSTYIQCDIRTGTWVDWYGGKSFTWEGCPDSYINSYLNYIDAVDNSLILDQKNITISCQESNFAYGGQEQPTSRLGGNDRIVIACGDPTIASNHSECQATMIHELTHAWEATRENNPLEYNGNPISPEDNTSFSQLIGCQEDPANPGTYKFGPGQEPLTDYGKTNCVEAFAVSSEIYRDPSQACNMKRERPVQYNWFLNNPNSPYKNMEYCGGGKG